MNKTKEIEEIRDIERRILCGDKTLPSVIIEVALKVAKEHATGAEKIDQTLIWQPRLRTLFEGLLEAWEREYSGKPFISKENDNV